ncbi:MAG: nucleotidyltransferase family protein [Daejeonella sp.]|uniref:nucleotidyltransferase family protein n=1 Tax=Daejeonella sp. TaxID=2805397 RepID=UPI003C73AEC9
MENNEPHFKIESYSIIILAAGDSSRLGSPKQLLPFSGKALLQRAIDNAKKCEPDQVIVVLGSRKQLIENEINQDGAIIVENQDWKSGIASSIRTGINELKNISVNTDAAILMACDQPFADENILQALIQEHTRSGNAIVGSSYDNTKGIPALFHKNLFSDLLALEGDSGAKKLFEKYKGLASFVSFQKGGIDIDTSEDYKNLTK